MYTICSFTGVALKKSYTYKVLANTELVSESKSQSAVLNELYSGSGWICSHADSTHMHK